MIATLYILILTAPSSMQVFRRWPLRKKLHRKVIPDLNSGVAQITFALSKMPPPVKVEEVSWSEAACRELCGLPEGWTW